MKSAAHAILWETAVRGRWSVPGFFILSNLIPCIVFSALSAFSLNGIERDPAWAIMHFSFLALSITQAAIGIVLAQSTMSRLYAAPISTAALVAWHMFPGAILIGTQIAIACGFHNYIFHLNQPIVGPSLFAMTMWCCTTLLIHQTHRTFLSVIATASPMVLMLIWLRSRYGEFDFTSAHLWESTTTSELGVMAGVCVAAYFATILGIARDRCSEPFFTFGITNRLAEVWTTLFAKSYVRKTPFRSPQAAQIWYETASKQWALPAMTGAIVGCTFVGWMLNQILPSARTLTIDNLQSALFVCGGAIVFAAGVAGMILGLGTISGDRHHSLSQLMNHIDVYRMPQYHATKPITSRSFGIAILIAAIRSLMIALSVWLVAYVACLTLGWVNHHLPKSILPPTMGLWYPLLITFGGWIAISNVAAMGLSGRGTIMTYCLIALLFIYVAASSAGEALLTQSINRQLQWTMASAASLIVITFCVQSFCWAIQRAMISYYETLAAAAIAATVIAVAIATSPADINAAIVLWITAFASLVVAPIAVTPLSIEWNRYR